jgi:hypothetical protein
MENRGAKGTPDPERDSSGKTPPEGKGEDGLGSALTAVAAVGGLLTVGAGLVFGVRTACSVGVGAMIATANLYVLAKIVAKAMGGAAQAGSWSVLGAGKMIALVFVVWLLLTHEFIDPLSLLVGYGSLPIGIALSPLLRDKDAKKT